MLQKQLFLKLVNLLVPKPVNLLRIHPVLALPKSLDVLYDPHVNALARRYLDLMKTLLDGLLAHVKPVNQILLFDWEVPLVFAWREILLGVLIDWFWGLINVRGVLLFEALTAESPLLDDLTHRRRLETDGFPSGTHPLQPLKFFLHRGSFLHFLFYLTHFLSDYTLLFKCKRNLFLFPFRGLVRLKFIF